jgi:voltage-gated sodium channel
VEHWGNLGAALLTLFQMVTLEGWIDVMDTAMEALPWSWIYFVTFVLIGTFVMLNLFIAVVINNLEASKVAELESLEQPPGRDEIVEELKRTREALTVLQRKLEALPDMQGKR